MKIRADKMEAEEIKKEGDYTYIDEYYYVRNCYHDDWFSARLLFRFSETYNAHNIDKIIRGY